MRMMKAIAALSLALLLGACGGGGCDAGSSPITGASTCGGDTPVVSVSAIDVLASSPQVGSGGDTVDITAVVKGAGNVSLADTAVIFTSTSGVLTGVSATTDSSGVATAKLAAGADKSNRNVTVQVSAGSVKGSVDVAVNNTKLALAGPTTVALGKTATLTVTATDSKGLAIQGLAVTVDSTLGNGLSATELVTGAQGTATVDYTASKSGTDSVEFAISGFSIATPIQISGENFTFVSPSANSTIPVDTLKTVTVQYFSGGAPQSGKTVNFAATAGVLTASSAVTGADGKASVKVSSSTASPATVQATVQGGAVQASLPIEFVAIVPDTLVLQVSPTAIGPNAAGATEQQAQVLAKVRDKNNNPVKGVTVNFNRTVDPSGGNLNQASAVTDSSGQASVQYIAGELTTSSNGVRLTGTVAFGAGAGVTGAATLTVNQSALFIALGTGNTITNYDVNTYEKPWTVYVTDANGIAVPNINLTIKILPVKYLKGHLVFNKAWVYSANVKECENEDLNYNGVLDAGEDFNQSGVLEPGNVIAVSPSTIRTDANGRATILLRYAESYVPWVRVKLRAEAVVSGTESSKEAEFVVPGLSSDFSNEAIPPAGVISPFGENACGVKN